MTLMVNSRGNLHESRGGRFSSDGFRDSKGGRLGCVSGGQRQIKGSYQAQVHSDQMVLMMAGQEGWMA
jgi:hypothetical protein